MGVNPIPPAVSRRPIKPPPAGGGKMKRIVSHIDGVRYDLEDVWETISKVESNVDERFKQLNFLFNDDPEIKSKLDVLARRLVEKYPDRYSYREDSEIDAQRERMKQTVKEMQQKYGSTKAKEKNIRQESSKRVQLIKLYLAYLTLITLLLFGAFFFIFKVAMDTNSESTPPAITEQSTESGNPL